MRCFTSVVVPVVAGQEGFVVPNPGMLFPKTLVGESVMEVLNPAHPSTVEAKLKLGVPHVGVAVPAHETLTPSFSPNINTDVNYISRCRVSSSCFSYKHQLDAWLG